MLTSQSVNRDTTYPLGLQPLGFSLLPPHSPMVLAFKGPASTLCGLQAAADTSSMAMSMQYLPLLLQLLE